MYLGDLMEKAESGQFSILSFLLQESQTTVKAVMEETGFSKATLTKYVTLLNEKALDSGLELTIHLSLIHISEPTRRLSRSRMPSSA